MSGMHELTPILGVGAACRAMGVAKSLTRSGPCAPLPCCAPTAATRRCSHKRPPAARWARPARPPADAEATRAVIRLALAEGRELLDEVQAKAVLQAYGIPVVATVAVDATAEAAAAAAQRCGYPVALKILSPDITHKSDVGGVRLQLADAAAVREAADAMLAQVRRLRPQARIQGFTVQRMAQRPGAHEPARPPEGRIPEAIGRGNPIELIIGASVDPAFGPVLLFGQGGTAVEVLADRALALPPLNRVLARELVSRTRVARLLAGYRDRPAADLDAVCDVLIAVAQMLADLPQLAETLPSQDRQVLLRPIRPEDEARHRAFMALLSPEDMRLRFFSSRRELPRSELARLVQIDYAREMAFIALDARVDAPDEVLGVVRAVCDPDNADAEFAIVVRSDLKGQGLGHQLLGKMIRYLKAHGTQRMVGDVLRDNPAMRDLMSVNGFGIDAAASDSSTVRHVLPLQPQ
jgi:acetyltransferase